MRTELDESMGEGLMRRKADGGAFETEFRKCMSRDFYLLRLPTLSMGYAGLSQPADFVLIGDNFNYVELKETAGDSFSITSMQQYPQMKRFVEERARLQNCEAVRSAKYWVVVHFLAHKVLKVVEAEQAIRMSEARKTIRFDDAVSAQFSSLEEMRKEMVL